MINWEARYRELEEQMATMLLQIASKYEELESRAAAAEELSVNQLHVTTVKSKINAIAHANGKDLEYAFAIYGPRKYKEVSKYSKKNSHNFVVKENGNYRVWAHVREVNNPHDVAVKKSVELMINGVNFVK